MSKARQSSELFREGVWDNEVIQPLLSQFDGRFFDWISEVVLVYLREVEPELLESVVAFVHISRWVTNKEILHTQAWTLHNLEPFVELRMLSIVTHLLLAKIAWGEGKASSYNTPLLSILRLLSERPAFARGGLDILRRAYQAMLERERISPGQSPKSLA